MKLSVFSRLFVNVSVDDSKVYPPALGATQGQMDVLFSQSPYKCHLFEVASVRD